MEITAIPTVQNKWALSISYILNKYNNLTVTHSPQTILNSNIKYFIDLNEFGEIICCCGLKPINLVSDKIVHLSTVEEYRKKGLAYNLVKYVINKSDKKIITMDIRHNNRASLTLATKLGFKLSNYKLKNNYYIITVTKNKFNDRFKLI